MFVYICYHFLIEKMVTNVYKHYVKFVVKVNKILSEKMQKDICRRGKISD